MDNECYPSILRNLLFEHHSANAALCALVGLGCGTMGKRELFACDADSIPDDDANRDAADRKIASSRVVYESDLISGTGVS